MRQFFDGVQGNWSIEKDKNTDLTGNENVNMKKRNHKKNALSMMGGGELREMDWAHKFRMLHGHYSNNNLNLDSVKERSN